MQRYLDTKAFVYKGICLQRYLAEEASEDQGCLFALKNLRRLLQIKVSQKKIDSPFFDNV